MKGHDINSGIEALSVQIVKFVDDAFPGWVECEFADADGGKHRVIDKYLFFTNETLEPSSIYPRPGFVRCEVLDRSLDSRGRELVRITIARPDPMETTEGKSEFIVVSTALQSNPWPAS